MEVMFRLEMAMDRQPLVAHEESLQKKLKLKALALSSLQRTIARQESRLLRLREGDALTKFFLIHANVRHRMNFIGSVEHDGQVLVSEDDKARGPSLH
jgi:hypothetical protein